MKHLSIFRLVPLQFLLTLCFFLFSRPPPLRPYLRRRCLFGLGAGAAENARSVRVGTAKR